MKKIKSCKRPLTFILILCIMFTAINLFSFADDARTEADTSFNSTRNYNITQLPDEISGRIMIDIDKDKLDEYIIEENDDIFSINVKNPDNSYTSTTFTYPVKYENSKGDLQFIDNSFENKGFFESALSGYDYKNKAGTLNIEYSKDPIKGVKLSSDGHDFKMSLFEKPLETKVSSSIEKSDNPGENEAFRYYNAFGEDMHVNYYNTHKGIKEDIILEKNTGKNRFEFFIDPGKLVPVLSDDFGEIYFVDSADPDNIIYIMEHMYAFDSYIPPITEEVGEYISSMDGIKQQMESMGNGAYEESDNAEFSHITYDCRYELEILKKGGYKIIAIVPEDWLNHSDLVYPVTIDPSISTFAGQSNAQGSFVCQGQPNSNYEFAGDYVVGKYNGGNAYLYFKINLPSGLPAYSAVTNATLQLNINWNPGYNIDVYEASQSWVSTNITWNNQPWPVMNYVHQNVSHNNNTNYKANVTTAVRNWRINNVNNGLVITYNNLNQNNYTVIHNHRKSSGQPVLTITYNNAESIPDGIYLLRNNNSGKYLEVPGGTTQWGIQLVSSDFSNRQSLQWKVKNIGNNVYTIRPMHAQENALDTYYGASLGGMIDMYPTSDGNPLVDTKWVFIKNADGSYRIMSVVSKQFYGVVANANGNCFHNSYTGSSREEWVLKKEKILHSDILIPQENSSWCWIASAQMATRALRPDFAHPTQKQIAQHVIQSGTIYRGAYSPSEVEAAVEHACWGMFNFDNTWGNISESELFNQLNSGNPVIIMRKYYYKHIEGNGHVIVAYGYKLTSTGIVYCVADPGPKPNQKVYELSYTQLLCEAITSNSEWRWYGISGTVYVA